MMEIMIELTLLLAVGVIDAAVYARLARNLKLLEFTDGEKNNQNELPSVTICIPARNETHAMTECLERVVASDYPKLEIIVLDDGSRDNTSVLIKSFAHAGVRFIEGKELPEGWLGKNYAQSILADEASGRYVFFMDVDTHVDRFTVARAINYLLQHNARMVSIIPTRSNTWRTNTLFATMRHFWTALRFSPNRPQATANAWIIEREYLVKKLGESTALPMSVQLETSLARDLAESHDYRLVLSSHVLGLSYEKRWTSQVETSTRLLFPQNGKNILRACMIAAVLMLALFPYIIVWWQPMALLVILLQFIIAMTYLHRTWGRYAAAGAFFLPYTLAQELLLLFMSVYKYARGTITWKGRPITSRKIT
jgi:hypothetical protein